MSLMPKSDNPSREEILAIASAIRAAPSIMPTERCDWSASVPSPSVQGRQVELQIYDAPSLRNKKDGHKRPAILNWHGSGYMVPRLGRDAYLARYLSQNLDVTFVDADYAKAPEHPFPAGILECIPSFRWVLQQPWFDGNLILCGLSAGGQFAVSLSSRDTALSLGLTAEEYSHIKATIGFYPATDATIPADLKKTNEGPVPVGIPMAPLSKDLMTFFFSCYIGFDQKEWAAKGKDPRVSPAFADPASYQIPLYIVACEHDPLGAEATNFAQALLQQPNNKHEYYFAQGVGHGFETRVPEIGQPDFEQAPGSKAKKEAYENMLAFLRSRVPAITK